MKYYVYEHYNPYSNETVYIGHGSKERAWLIGGDKSASRSPDHHQWITSLLENGFTPDQWVRVLQRDLTKKEACSLEGMLIVESVNKPRFNKLHVTGANYWSRLRLTSWSSEQLNEARTLREQGMSYERIAKQIGRSTMRVWRALNEERTRN